MLKKIKQYARPPVLTLILLEIVLLFGLNPDQIEAGGSYASMVVPHIDMNMTVAFFAISILGLAGCFLSGKLRIDNVALLLFVRIFLYFMAALSIDNGIFKIGIAYAIVQCFFAYVIGRSYRDDLKTILRVLIAFTFVICVEVFYVLIVNNLSVFSSSLKWYMVLPLGRYNYICCILLPIYALVLNYYLQNRIFIYIYSILIGIATLCTGSRWGLLVFLLILFATVVKEMGKAKVKKKSLIVAMGIVLVASVLVLVNGNRVDYLLSGTIARYEGRIAYSRLLVYKDVLDLFWEHPLLGRSAFSYVAYDAVKAHNFLLESLVQTGILGSIIFLVCLIKVFKLIKKGSPSLSKSFVMFYMVFLLQGLAEPNMFGASSDFFFWLLLGIFVSQSTKLIERV